MKKLNKIEGVLYTQNAELPIEERVFFSEGLVADINDYRIATEEDIAEWESFKRRQNGDYVPTELDLLKEAIDKKIEDIKNFDSSSAINEFTINGVSVWLDKATRTGLMLRFQSESAIGETETCLWYNGIQFTMSINDALRILYLLEVYASKCYDNTERHVSIVSKITTIEELNSYDYTVGYPEKLHF